MKISVFIKCFVLFVLINTSGAFAAFECIYMADVDGNIKTAFDWDDQPYLHLKLPHAGYSYTSAFWVDPDIISYPSGGDMSYDEEVVLTLDNWDTVKKIGNWNIDALYLYSATGEFAEGETSFCVLPEPSSIMLFSIGMAFFAAGFFRKVF